MATTEERLTSLEQQVSTVATKVDMMILEAQQQREDIRRLQDRHDAAQAKHDAEMKEMNAKHATDMHEMNERFYSKIDDLGKQMHANFIQTMIGVGAIMVAIGGLIIAVLK